MVASSIDFVYMECFVFNGVCRPYQSHIGVKTTLLHIFTRKRPFTSVKHFLIHVCDSLQIAAKIHPGGQAQGTKRSLDDGQGRFPPRRSSLIAKMIIFNAFLLNCLTHRARIEEV